VTSGGAGTVRPLALGPQASAAYGCGHGRCSASDRRRPGLDPRRDRTHRGSRAIRTSRPCARYRRCAGQPHHLRGGAPPGRSAGGSGVSIRGLIARALDIRTVRGIRGATSVASDTPDGIAGAVDELLAELRSANDLNPSAVISAIFTVTPDLV